MITCEKSWREGGRMPICAFRSHNCDERPSMTTTDCSDPEPTHDHAEQDGHAERDSDACHGVQASNSSATLLDQMDKEQDHVLTQLDQLNVQIESLIGEYAQTRRSDSAVSEPSVRDGGIQRPNAA